MGDYSTIHVTGKVKKEYREKLRWFFRPGGGIENLSGELVNVFSLDTLDTQQLVREWARMDRASFTLFGGLCYSPDHSWEALMSTRNKVGEDGFLRILASSKNKASNDYFARKIVPLLFEEGYSSYVGPYH